MSFSSSDHEVEAEYQPGGTALIVGQPWSGRATTSSDPSGLGRWTEATLIGKDERKVTIVCAYCVCKNTISTTGPSTAFAQQWHLLRMKGDERPDPCGKFFADLGTRIQELTRDKHEVLIMLDANDTLQAPNNTFSRWVRLHRLVDIHVRRLGTDGEPPTYARGKHRIHSPPQDAGASRATTHARCESIDRN